VNSGAPEELAVPVPLVAPVVEQKLIKFIMHMLNYRIIILSPDFTPIQSKKEDDLSVILYNLAFRKYIGHVC
jgi:hypothetical protein